MLNHVASVLLRAFCILVISTTLVGMDHAPAKTSPEKTNNVIFSHVPSLDTTPTQQAPSQYHEPYFLHNPTVGKASIDKACTSQFSNCPDPLMVTLKELQKQGKKEEIKKIRDKLKIQLDKAWFGGKAIRSQIQKVDSIYNSRITDLIWTVKHGTKEQATQAIKEIRRLSPYRHAPENVCQQPSQYYSMRLKQVVKETGFNALLEAEVLFNAKHGLIQTQVASSGPQHFSLSEKVLPKKNESELQHVPRKLETCYDLKLTTPTDVDSEALKIFQEKVTADPKTDFATYMHQVSDTIETLKQKGLYTAETVALFTRDFAVESANYCVHIAQHPTDTIHNFVQSNLELAKELGALLVEAACAPDEQFGTAQQMMEYTKNNAPQAEKIVQLLDHVYETVPQMSREEWAKLTSHMFVDSWLLHGIGKGWNVATKFSIPSNIKKHPLFNRLHKQLEHTLSKYPELVTTEGLVVKAPQALEETNVLKNAMEKAKGTTKEVIKDATKVEGVANMKQVFEKSDFGKILSSKTQKLRGRKFHGQQIYKITEKGTGNYLKKGDHFYLDALHMDHIEVFDKQGNFKTVLNLDGTVSVDKVKAARRDGRSISKLL